MEAEEGPLEFRVVRGEEAAARELAAEDGAAVVLALEDAEGEAVLAEAEGRHDVAEAEEEPRLREDRQELAVDEEVEAARVVAPREGALAALDAVPRGLERLGRREEGGWDVGPMTAPLSLGRVAEADASTSDRPSGR